MQTVSKQTLSTVVDITNLISDRSNPIIQAFMQRGQVFGFASQFIVAQKLFLTETIINSKSLSVDNKGRVQ